MDCTPVFKNAKLASQGLNLIEADAINKVLLMLATAVVSSSGAIISANKKDLALMKSTDPNYDRLMLTPERISAIASDINTVAALTSPVYRLLEEKVRPNGLKISRISVPFGVIGVIYEARPNVTLDVFSLCFKSGNACILKGGSEAINSNTVIVEVIKSVLRSNGIDENVISLLPAGRDETIQLLNAFEYVELIIPRGSRSLIDYVRENSFIPVIETGAGICHTYFDESGDRDKARLIINNAKTRRVSVCNALDCLILHESRLEDLDHIVGLCSVSDVMIYADPKAFEMLNRKYPSQLLQKATEDSFGTEFLSYKMAVKTVASFDEALLHIANTAKQLYLRTKSGFSCFISQ
jgi:glutamate-5-semialdehyde dehydrogenase